MPVFINQLRHAARRLGRTPLFTVIAVVTLAIGIGANTAIFSVVEGVLLKPLPYDQPERLVAVWHSAPQFGLGKLNVSPTNYFIYREENRCFEDLAVWDDGAYTITGQSEPERVNGVAMTYSLLSVLHARPAAGRDFTERDDQPGSPETVILSYGFWQRKFGGDPKVIGRRIIVDGRARNIIGVMPRHFRFLDLEPALFLPMRFDRSKVFVGNFSYQAIARLKPEATLAQANADVARMFPMMFDRFPLAPGISRAMLEGIRMNPDVHPVMEDVVGDVGKVLWVLMGTVGIVLLIACANVANLFLVRAEGRQQEFAIRAAMGAGRGKLARELLTESVGLAILGGVLGVGFAYAGIRLLVYLAPANLPRLSSIGIDAPVLFFALAVSVLAGILFGLIPVFKYSSANLGSALKEGGRTLSEGRPRHRARNVLVIAQVALALVLLVSAGLMGRTFQAMRNVNPGFARPAEIQTIHVPIERQAPPEQLARAHEQIIERIRRIPGVVSVGASSSVTMDASNHHDPIFVENVPLRDGQVPPMRTYKFITPGYLETMGIPLVAGRGITWQDTYGKQTALLISENLAGEYWKTPAEAIGKRVRENTSAPWREIIGVVGTERDDGVDRKPPTIVYWPIMVDNFWNFGTTVRPRLTYAIRSPRTGTPGFANEIRQAVWSVEPAVAVTGVRTMQKIMARSMARTSFTLVMLGIASAMALLLGLVGIYGVMSYAVTQRTREIGIRIALGAEAPQVRRMFLRHGLTLAAIGVAAGLASAAALTRGMSSLLFGVGALDPWTYTAVAASLIAAAMLASYIPARRATAVDPARALKAE